MLYKFRKNIERILASQSLSGSEDGILVCVSGGPDSMAMLDLMRQCSLKIAAAHVNFHLRPGECDNDQKLVEDYCKLHHIELHVKHFNTLEYARDNGVSVEMAARELRYSWFEEIRQSLGLAFIAVAHNANDNAETLLLNLTRGTGLRGICGMKGNGGSCSRIIRPLLGIERKSIIDYLNNHGVRYAVDSTNASNDYKRNKLRNSVFPLLKEMNSSIIATMNSNAANFNAAMEVLDGLRPHILEKICINSPEEYIRRAYCADVSVPTECHTRSQRTASFTYLALKDIFAGAMDIKELRGEKGWKFWLHEWISGFGANPAQTAELAAMIESEQPKSAPGRMVFPEHIAIIERGFIKIFKAAACPLASRVSIEDKGTHYRATFQGSLPLEFRKGTSPYIIRTPHPSDSFTAFGRNSGRKSLSDYLTNLKIETVLKNIMPLICINDEIAAIAGIEISNKFRI